MQKISLKKIIIITLFVITFLGINIVIISLFIPKFIPNGNSLLNMDFNNNNDLEYYLNQYEKILFDYSKEGLNIEKNIGNNNSPALVLEVLNKQEYIHFIITNNKYSYLKLEALVRLEKTEKSNEKFPALWLYIVDNKGNKYWDMPHNVKNFFTLFKWKKVKDYFYIPSFANKIHFIISNNSISGKMICDDIKLTPFQINPSFKIYRLIIFLIFFIFLIAILFIFHKFVINFLKQIIIFIAIIAGILGPKIYIYRIAYYFHINDLFIQKVGHFLMFFLLSFFVYLNRKYFENREDKNFKYLLIIELISIAVLTEMLQFFTFSRSMSLYDCIIDSAGIILAIIFADYCNLRKNKNNNNSI